MSSYTMELREIIEMYSQYQDNLSHKEKIEIGRKKLFDFDYEIFDSSYKAVFETNFIRKFYMREIGFETEGLFKFQLESWLLINMPYFNKLFESTLKEYDPLINSEMISDSNKTKDTDGQINRKNNETLNRNDNQTSNGTQSESKFDRRIENDTPDSRLAITTQDGSGVIEYASLITEDVNKNASNSNVVMASNSTNNNSSNNDTTTDITETEKYVQHRSGKIGSVTYSKMMMEYRQSLIRVENKMFDELQQLFMLVY